MNIFIYGSKSFKKDINNVLDHANIKFKLDDDSIVKDIENLDELKSTIENSPHDIYLIEEEKIIKRNSLNSKVKFLTPKDGIDEEFLLEHSIPDVTIDSLEDLPKYIIKKHDEYLAHRESFEVQNEIIDIVDDAYAKEDKELNEEEKEESDYAIDDFSKDGLDEYKFEQNIENIDNVDNIDNINKMEDAVEVQKDNENLEDEESKKLEEEIIPEITVDDEPENINDFEKQLQNIDNLMDDDNSELKLDEDDSLDLNELEEVIEESAQSDNNVVDNIDDLLNDLGDLEEVEEDEESSENELEEKIDDEFLNELEDHFENEFEDTLNEDFAENNNKHIEEELNLDHIQNQIEENDDKIISTEDVKETGEEFMNEDISQLDDINEADLLAALNDTSLPSIKPTPAVSKPSSSPVSSNEQSLEVSGKDFEELAKLFSQLLNNKTIEITIKIKD